jgi:hypothetical protein
MNEYKYKKNYRIVFGSLKNNLIGTTEVYVVATSEREAEDRVIKKYDIPYSFIKLIMET